MSMKTFLVAPSSVSVLVMSCFITMNVSAAEPTLTGDAARGKTLYQACEACHSINENDIGPRHRGVVGRRAGSVSDYAYSDALKKSGIVWDEAALNRWLIDPSAMVPGTKMFFKIDNAQNRADLIAFLNEQKAAK
jgi:cytochrome c